MCRFLITLLAVFLSAGIGVMIAAPEASGDVVSQAASSSRGAEACFNKDLYKKGTRFVGSYVANPGRTIIDFVQVDRGIKSFNGKKVRKVVRNSESSNPSATWKNTNLVQVSLKKQRESVLATSIDNFTPQANMIDVTFSPRLLFRYDLAVDDSYKRIIDAISQTTNPFSGTPFTVRSTFRRKTTYRGIETIRVPAGEFEACRFESRTKVLSGDYVGSGLETIWVAVGSGVIIKEKQGGGVLKLRRGKLNGVKLGRRG